MPSRPAPADEPTFEPRRHRLASPFWAAALAVGLALAAAGCGGGGGDDVTLPGPEQPTPALSRTEFQARANEVCRATTRAIAARHDELGPASLGGEGDDPTAARQEIEKLARTAIARLRNLTPPPEDAATVQRAWDTMEAAVDAAGRDRTLPMDPVGLVQPDLFSYGLSGCFATG